MEHTKNRAIRPLLRLFRLRSAIFSNDLVGRHRFTLRLEQDIAVSVQLHQDDRAVDETKAAVTETKRTKQAKKTKVEPTPKSKIGGVVDIEFRAHFKDDDGNDMSNVVATAKYKALFKFSEEAKLADIEAAMKSEAYQYQFVAQATPLALQHFKDQLAAMGLSSNGILLGIA